MGRFASETSVPVERSRAEIEATLTRYGATEFVSGWGEGNAMVGFRVSGLFIQFILPIPDKGDKKFTHKSDRYGYLKRRTQLQQEEAWNQEIRQRWRALNLVVKAKLEAVECGISTIEKEFLAFIVLPNQMTLGDWIIESKALKQLSGGKMPLALTTGEPADDTEDAEVLPYDPNRKTGS